MATKQEKAAFGGQIDDAEAIYDYFKNITPRTDQAATLKAQFLTWWNQSSWFDKNFSQGWYDQLRSRRNAFNIANAVSDTDKAAVQRVLTSGLTAEEMQGKPRPQVDVKTGLVGTALKNPPAIPSTLGASFTRILKKGLQGEDVKKWQTFLGLTPPTGYFDQLTDTKTREFQGKNALVVDGLVGKNTLKVAFPVASTGVKEPPNAIPVVSAIKIPTQAQATQAAKVAQAVKSNPAVPSFVPSSAPAVLQAGMLDGLMDVGKWPLWAKIAGVGATLGMAALAIKEKRSL